MQMKVDLFDWVDELDPDTRKLQDRIKWLEMTKKRYEDALNEIIYDKKVNTLVQAVIRAKQALGVANDD
jgi:hypothetical protein